MYHACIKECTLKYFPKDILLQTYIVVQKLLEVSQMSFEVLHISMLDSLTTTKEIKKGIFIII